MFARISALVVWALVSATVVFWSLRLLARPPGAPATALSVGDAAVFRGDLTRLLGAPPQPSAAAPVPAADGASRFRLLGVMAPRPASGQGGVALIAVDGKPARAFRVGTPLDDALVLQSVSLRAAAIGPEHGPAAVTLQMPPLPSATTGVLPQVGGAPVPAARFVPSYPALPAPAPGTAPPPSERPEPLPQ